MINKRAHGETGTTALDAPERTAAPFDAARREAFLNALGSGVRSHREACRLIGLNRSTLAKWIKRGKKVPTCPEDEPYRAFYLMKESVEAMRDGLPDTVLHRQAQNDWRAADALGKRMERRELRRDIKRLEELEAQLWDALEENERLKAELAKYEVTAPTGSAPDSGSGEE